MNVTNIGKLTRKPVAGTWFRAVPTHFYASALQTAHTVKVCSRFSPGPLISSPFEILYLAETSIVAEFEIGAVFGQLASHISHPFMSFTTVNATVQLTEVVDLTDVSEQTIVDVDAQSLTGDWDGYQSRTLKSPVCSPTGIAPTQELGGAVFANSSKIEGLMSISAKVPTHRTLAIFPQNMRKGNFVEYRYGPSLGNRTIHRIDGAV